MLLFLLAVVRINGQYCNSGPLYTLDTNLGPVTLSGDQSGISDNTDCPRPIGPRDLTNLSADLTKGRSYTLRYSVTGCSGSVYYSLAGAWIDYNNNGVFEPTESLFPFVVHSSATNSAQASFVVPAGTNYTGSTRLRVQLQESTDSSLDPCFQFSYGGTKDFTVVIKSNSPYCNSGPTSNEDTQLGPALLQGETKDIVQYDPPCPGYLGPRVFSNQLANLRPGRTYPLSLSVVTCRKAYPNILSAAWIDFNGNYQFEANEQVLSTTNRFGALFTYFTVPLTATPGNSTLRAMVQEMIDGGNTIGPCDMFVYGGTQDYPLQILSQLENTNSTTQG